MIQALIGANLASSWMNTKVEKRRTSESCSGKSQSCLAEKGQLEINKRQSQLVQLICFRKDEFV